jgi:hypothetical protein
MRRGLLLLAVLVGMSGLPLGAADQAPAGFEKLFNGKDLTGWKVHNGKMEAWGAADGVLFTTGSGGGWLMTAKEYGDFELRLEYKMPVNGNSGVALRSPLQGDPAYTGMEIQLLDDDGPAYKSLKPTQYTGSIYDVVAAKRGATRPAGEWNQMQITAKGRKITVTLNGKEIVNANLDEYKDRVKANPEKKLAAHPGLEREKGHLGLQSHGSRVEFRNLYVKPL